MNRDQRLRRRDARDRMKALALVFLGLPLVAAIVDGDRYSTAQLLFLPAIGLLMFLWFRYRPVPPKHVVVIEHVIPGADDARSEPFFAAMCDCGWTGEDHAYEHSARHEALEHSPHVLTGLRKWGD